MRNQGTVLAEPWTVEGLIVSGVLSRGTGYDWCRSVCGLSQFRYFCGESSNRWTEFPQP